MENKNKIFEMPTATVVIFDNEDVITTSTKDWGKNGFAGVKPGSFD